MSPPHNFPAGQPHYAPQTYPLVVQISLQDPCTSPTVQPLTVPLPVPHGGAKFPLYDLSTSLLQTSVRPPSCNSPPQHNTPCVISPHVAPCKGWPACPFPLVLLHLAVCWKNLAVSLFSYWVVCSTDHHNPKSLTSGGSESPHKSVS